MLQHLDYSDPKYAESAAEVLRRYKRLRESPESASVEDAVSRLLESPHIQPAP